MVLPCNPLCTNTMEPFVEATSCCDRLCKCLNLTIVCICLGFFFLTIHLY